MPKLAEIQAIFEQAFEIELGAERKRFLDTSCASDPPLRREVEKLLEAYEQAGDFLCQPAVSREYDTAEGVNSTLASIDNDGQAAAKPAALTATELAGPETLPSLGFLAPSTKPGSLGRLGHYEVLSVIGHGGFGIVLRAFDERLHRDVAIKVMATQLALASSSRERLLREARAAAAVRHDNVVCIHAVEEQPVPYLVMEFFAGRNLQDKLDLAGKLETREVLHIGRQIAEGLAAAHEQGLIHRDIKPGNILLDTGPNQRVKLTDFGLARALDDPRVTKSGVIAGTPGYIAPEQAQGDEVDHRCDLFSLGCVLYCMCTGEKPFKGRDPMSALMALATRQPPTPAQLNPKVSERLSDLVMGLLAKDPARRPQSARAVVDSLNQIAREPAHEPQTTLIHQGSAPQISVLQQRRTAIAVTGVVLVAILATVIIRVRHGDGTTTTFSVDNAANVAVEYGGKDLTSVAIPKPVEPPTSAAAAGDYIVNSIGMKLVRVPAGRFVMGSPESEANRNSDEGPAHDVVIDAPFYIGVHEVTQQEYARVLGASPSAFAPTGKEAAKVAGLDTQRFPVETVSWHDAVAFCRKLSERSDEAKAGRRYRLPTEAEWEYACRAGSSPAPFCLGNSLSSYQANFNGAHSYGGAPQGPYLARTTTVASFQRNAFGLFDVHGNVWEWCADPYVEDKYRMQEKVQPGAEATHHVIRGGSWGSLGQNCRSADRLAYPSEHRGYDTGFRVVCDLRAGPP